MRVLPYNVVSMAHYVELDKSGWVGQSIELFACAILRQINSPASPQHLKSEILKNLLFEPKLNELTKALANLEANGHVTKKYDGRYSLTSRKMQEMEEDEKRGIELETLVKQNFISKVQIYCPEVDPENIWNIFIEYFLIPLVANEGAKSYDTLTGGKQNITQQSYVDTFIERARPNNKEALRQFLNHILEENNENTKKYLLKYLDAYFLVSASGLPSSVVSEISKINTDGINIVIFVDTNFIYSILGLHDNPSNEAATDLRELVVSISNNINIQFVVHPRTIIETRNSVTFHKNRLSKHPYPPNLAEAATATDVAGVYRTFFEKVRTSSQSISPEDYFMPYENNLSDLLKDKSVKVFDIDDLDKYENTLEVIEDVDTQVTWEKERYKERAKGEQKVTHDVLLWHFVQDQRGVQKTSALKAGYWIVTLDYRFLGFDKFKSKSENITIACMHPSQLIQILRFFIPRSLSLEKTLLGVMKFPITSREIDSKTEQMTLRILNLLARHEHIEDVPVPDLTSILADEALRLRLSSPGITETQEIDAVQNAFVEIVKKKDEQIKAKTMETQELQKSVLELENRVSKAEDDLRSKSALALQKNNEIEDKLKDTTTSLQKTEEEKELYRLQFRLLLGFIVFIIISIGIFIAPEILRWQWLLNHEHKLGLQLCISGLFFGLCWGFADTNRARKTLAFTSVIVTAFFTMTQII